MVNTELLKQRKKELKLSFDDIAARSGFARRSIIQIFQGKTPYPRINTLQKIAEVLKLSIDELTNNSTYETTEPVQTYTPIKQPETDQTTINFAYLKQRKKELNLSYDDIAKRSECARATVIRVLNGTTPCPRVDTMQAIERALGIENSHQEITQYNLQEANQYNLTADEMELIDAYRQILPSLKECSKELIERFVNIKLDKRCKKR